jgi:hypothetical protein
MSSPIVDDIELLRQRWTQLVEDVTPSFLPIQFPPNSPSDNSFGQLQIRLNIPAIGACCEECHLPLLDLVRTAWAGLLGFYNGSEDVLFGAIGFGPNVKRPNLSVCRAKVRTDYNVVNILNDIQERGMLESDRLTLFPDALNALSSLSPKPFNSSIWARHPLQEPKADVLSNSMVTLPFTVVCRNGMSTNS